jgi:hypothetical protein
MTNNFRLLAFALVIAAATASVPACKAVRRPPEGASARPPGAAGEAIARVGDLVITVGDVQNRINAQPPVVRSHYGSLDKKKQLVTDLVNFELMAAEAVRRALSANVSETARPLKFSEQGEQGSHHDRDRDNVPRRGNRGDREGQATDIPRRVQT